MADILKNNVQTYVRELIAKEFKSKNNEEKVFLEHCKINTGDHQGGQRRPLGNDPLMEEKRQ